MNKWVENTLGFGFMFVIASIIAFLLYLPVRSIVADGKADFCYVETHSYHTPNQADTVVYELKQHVPWRVDRYVGTNLRSPQEAAEVAAKFNCEIR